MSHTMLLDTVQINLLSDLCSIGTFLFVKTISILILANGRAKGQFLGKVFYFNEILVYVLSFPKQSELQLLSKNHPRFCFCTILSNNFLQKTLIMRQCTENVLQELVECVSRWSDNLSNLLFQKPIKTNLQGTIWVFYVMLFNL